MLRHLETKDNDPTLAFSPDGIDEMNRNILILNKGKKHQPIYKVRVYEKAEKFTVGQKGNKRTKFVEAAKGTNLFFAIYETEEIDKDTKKVIRKRSYSTIPLNVVIERQKQGLSSAPEDENGNLPKYILSPNDLVYVPTQEEINKGEVVMPIDRDRIYKMVDSSGITANFIPASTANLIFALPKATAEIYCNGEPIYQVDYFSNRIECKQLSDEVVAKLHNGDNVIAAHGWNTKENALLDFGLYMENKTYNDVDMAILKQMNVQATQTHYIYQCGDVELYLDFVSPSLLLEQCLMGCPVGFISYQIHSGKSEIHDVEILFDIDTEWMFGKNRVESLSEQDWCIVKSDSLYMGIAAEETAYSYNEGHVLLSQKLGKNKKDQGVLLFGFNEGKGLQYEGEILHPYWNKDGKRELKDALLFIGDNYKKLMRECDRLDGQLNRRAFQTRIPSFARQMILDYRKFISEHRFVMSQSGDLFCFGDTLANVRESYSNFPILLSLNRMDWMKGLLEPVFEYCENDYWRKSYPPYDIGIYPIANRQVKVDDYAVEMAADMLIMITAIVEAEQDFGYADAHWNLLCLWADYLREKMKKEVYPCGGLLNEDDERVKCVLGLMAYRKLIQLKESV